MPRPKQAFRSSQNMAGFFPKLRPGGKQAPDTGKITKRQGDPERELGVGERGKEAA